MLEKLRKLFPNIFKSEETLKAEQPPERPLTYKEQIELKVIEALADIENWKVRLSIGRSVWFTYSKISNLEFRYCGHYALSENSAYDVTIDDIAMDIPFKYKKAFYTNIGYALFEARMKQTFDRIKS